MSSESYIDKEVIASYRKETTVSGIYMNAWNSLIKEKSLPSDIESYLITFSETDAEILIYFTKPTTKKIVGGGNGVARISKSGLSVISFELSK